MEESDKKLTKEQIVKIGRRDDFHIAALREDGQTYGSLTWIWSVEVDGKLYCRAFSGKESKWYKAAMQHKAGKISSGGHDWIVRFEPVTDSNLNDLIDAAYEKKYRDDEYLPDMVSQKSRQATVHVYTENEKVR